MSSAAKTMDAGPLVAAARAVLASGAAVRVRDGREACLIQAIDGLTSERFTLLRDGANGPCRLVLTGERTQHLGIAPRSTGSLAMALPADIGFDAVRGLAEPGFEALAGEVRPGFFAAASEAETAGIELVKRAGLLPAILSTSESGALDAVLELDAALVFAQAESELSSLVRVVETRLPITASESCRIAVFRSPIGTADQVALSIGNLKESLERGEAPLVRLHSECLTGDLFGSLRCDCGLQLQGAIAHMTDEGAGILLYLRQEGRGIGLINKLRAYRLQDQGYDTVDANMHLGFQADERDFRIAARILSLMGVKRIRLLTNNPDKVRIIAQHGIEVVERVPLFFAANCHNRAYLQTKLEKSGHFLRVIDGARGSKGDVASDLARILRGGPGEEIGA
ncbi:GTP cyclohydrolase II [Arboricoccus pini]|uniref:GTP cyclohydrolase-2 n=1 Tax=Arboricoccus pini TaxID=1963835 RepID=A0A212Q739_9PROT|nr:GTP cyclohydrolase II [Arboricoccus pini]SNB55142.1 GTP cyclohydrolase II [Arboricoccus pini]